MEDIRAALDIHGVPHAVAASDSRVVYNWIMSIAGMQGVSDAAATSFQHEHGSATWAEVDAAMRARPPCPRLRSYWNFECGFRKASRTCLQPDHIDGCPVPRLPLRKGSLNEAAFSLWLFVRDIAGGDLVGWIDARLVAVDPGYSVPDRAARMRAALLEPLCEIRGFGPKIWSMMLADMLLAADPGRERWTTTGASMIAADTLVHNHLYRTGLLRRTGAGHIYGPLCATSRGCVGVIENLSAAFDARSINADFPARFPRLIQHSIWAFCAASEWDVCNGNRIDDRARCQQRYCPCDGACERIALHAGGMKARS